MDVGDIRLYKERWKAIEEIERQELRAMTLEERWQMINAMARFGIEIGLNGDIAESEIEVFQTWVKIKQKYEAGK